MTSNPDWKTVDRWLMGEAFVGSRLDEHLYEICERIGPRWAGTPGDVEAGRYIRDRFEEIGLSEPRLGRVRTKGVGLLGVRGAHRGRR